MNLSKNELEKENIHLDKTISLIRNKISDLGQVLYDDQEKVLEFKKYVWDSRTQMDPGEMKNIMSSNDLEVELMLKKGLYMQKLYKIQDNPYFGSIIFQDDKETNEVYIGITHVEENHKYYVHDWRSPICSLFYDYEIGKASYVVPRGVIEGNLLRKRQYKITDGKLLRVFDNNLNIDDELLQEVLASESSDKMKNIVNTIQQEQNQVIRNMEDNNLIVQGIAGSGKTSVALHRIAFLLYKIEYLNSNNILIFSPNSIFSEYISNVLPELGEENTLQTTFNDFLMRYLPEYKKIESFTSFIERYYKYKTINIELITYKQSNEIIEDFNNYINDIKDNMEFTKGIEFDHVFEYTKEELNEMFKYKYSRFHIFNRINEMAIKICDQCYRGKFTHKSTIVKLLNESINVSKDYKKIYRDFYLSKYCKIKLSDKEINDFIYVDVINYEDACLFSYMKCLLEGYPYDNITKQIVIDEAQDYNRLQYIILTNIFRKADFTILGDINQTINPYYKYDSLYEIKDLFTNDTKCIELTKTYRSSEEIIEHTNKILNLSHVSAIRRGISEPVVIKEETNLKEDLIKDINALKEKSKSIAIITKNDVEVEKVYNLLKKDIKIHKITSSSNTFNRDLVIIPSYMAKGLEFDSVIIYTDKSNKYTEKEKYLYYVACTRSQHCLIIYNQ